MAKFIFPLEAALKQRKLKEDMAQRNLAKLMEQKNLMEDRLRQMQSGIREDKHAMADQMIGKVDVTRIRQHAAHSGQVTIHAQQLLMRLYGIHRQIEEARQLLLEASKAKKSVELLKERQFEAWRKEQLKLEQSQLDELATQAYFRNKGAAR